MQGNSLRRLLAAATVLAVLNGEAAVAADECYALSAPDEIEAKARSAVVITDPAVFANADFSFSRTIGQIIKTATAGVKIGPDGATLDTPFEQAVLVNSMLRTMRVTERINPDSGLSVLLKPRPNEAGLNPADLLSGSGPNGMRPVGLFNRFDLAPQDAAYCGEHRIVYAKGDTTTTFDRFLVIFEAALRNPRPDLGMEGCRPVAKFWSLLQGEPPEEQARLLQAFYYVGLDTNGDQKPDFQPVVHYEHFGIPFGQVRGNLFMPLSAPGMKDSPWQLREWRIALGPDSVPTFIADTVKNNPVAKLFGPADQNDTELMAKLRGQFQSEFLTANTAQLTEQERIALSKGSALDSAVLIADVGAGLNGKYNSFRGAAQAIADNEDDHPGRPAAGTPLLGLIGTRLNSLGVAKCEITPAQLLNRAGAMTCGGCHEFSAAEDPAVEGPFIAPGVKWPPSLGFVHIDEAGNLSDALERFFLPRRFARLEEFLGGSGGAKPPFPSALLGLDQKLSEVQSAGSASERIESLSELEAIVGETRAFDSAQPGFFVTNRRAH